MMPRAAFDYCEQHWPELWQSVRANWTSPTNQQLMAEYLMGTDSGWTDGRPARSGYYVGARLIIDLLQRGHELRQLTLLPVDHILALVTK